ERRPEERHDPVAHYLVDGALITMDGLHHPLEDWIEDLARFLGVAVGEQFHRALEVGEEDRDLLALALEGRLRCKNLLREVLRRIGLGRFEPRLEFLRLHGCPAPVAEPGLGWKVSTTGSTRDGKADSAPEAEARLRRILVLALGTLHHGLSTAGRRMSERWAESSPITPWGQARDGSEGVADPTGREDVRVKRWERQTVRQSAAREFPSLSGKSSTTVLARIREQLGSPGRSRLGILARQPSPRWCTEIPSAKAPCKSADS